MSRAIASLTALGLWSVFPQHDALAAGFQSFGVGCPDRSGVAPTLEIDGHANPGGSVILRFDGAANRSQVFLFAGLGAAVPGAVGCVLELASPSPIPLGPIQLDAQGEFTLATAIPGALPAPFDFAIQAVELDDLAPNGQFGISNGLRVELDVGRLYPVPVFDLGELPIDLAWGDVDNDGDGDVIGVAQQSTLMPIAVGDGNGRFSPGTPFFTATTLPNAVAAGDLDADGDLDVAITGHWIALHFGDGTGQFSTSQLHAGWITKSAPLLSDLDSDGDVDVLTLEAGTDRLHVLHGLGAGVFATSTQSYLVGDKPREISVGDLDGDGLLDVAVANSATNTVSVLFDAPGGLLTPSQTVIVPGKAWAVAIADMNLDAVGDLVVGSRIPEQIAVLRGNGTGGFLDPQITSACYGFWSLQVFDHDEDSIPDVVSANDQSRTLCLHRGAGDGTLALQNETNIGIPAAVARVADVDGDGATEFVTLAPYRLFSVVEREGENPFAASDWYPIKNAPNGLATHDLNSDGFLDLVAGSRYTYNPFLGLVTTHMGGPGGKFGPTVEHYVDFASVDLACGDIDDDGDIDVVSAQESGFGDDIEVLLGDGTGALALPVIVASSTSIQDIVLADLNNDGLVDAVSSEQDSDTSAFFGIGVRLSAPGAVLPSFVAFATPHRPRSLVVADFDLDGALDVVATHPDVDSVSLLRGDGTGGFGPVAPFIIGAAPESIAAADIDRDGFLDVAARLGSAPVLAFLRNDNQGGFAAAVNSNLELWPGEITMPDVDGDGYVDLVTTIPSRSSVAIGLGDGLGGFGHLFEFAAGFGVREILSADFDHDSTVDLAVTSGAWNSNGSLHVLLHR
jgi:hypothetical protein